MKDLFSELLGVKLFHASNEKSLGSYIVWICLCLLICSNSCTELVSDEFPDFDTVPALNSILVAGKTIQVQLSLADKVDTTDINLVENGIVLLSGSKFPEFELPHIERGMYSTTRLVAPGEIYRSRVEVEDFKILTASDTVPMFTPVEIVWHSNQSRLDEEGYYMGGVEFEFSDNPDTRDFYEVVLFKRESGSIHNSMAFNENEPILLNEGLEPYSTGTLLFSDELMDDSIINMKLYFHYGIHLSIGPGDYVEQVIDEHTLILELRHVSRAYYDFRKSWYIYRKSRYPDFVEGTTKASNIYSNVENGYGIFAAFAATVDSLFVEEERIPR